MIDQGRFTPAQPQMRTDARFLDRAIRSDVIPRLLKKFPPQPANPVPNPEIGVGAALEFAARLHEEDGGAAEAFIAALSAVGVPPATLLLDLFTPAARELGRQWAEDEASFIDVSIALCRMHRLAQAHAGAMETSDCGHGGRALIAAPPGAQHQLGALIVEAFMRSGGWRVEAGPFASAAEIAAEIARRPYRVLGLSIACRDDFPAAMETIRRARAARPDLFVMVGGAAVNAEPEAMHALGADAAAATAADAVALANEAREAATRAH